MNKILILSNDTTYTFKLRKELILKLIEEKFEVFICSNLTGKLDELRNLNVKLFDQKIDSRGMNFFNDLKTFFKYLKLIKTIKPFLVLTFTIKPNIYGAFASILTKTNYIPTITGLGSSVQKTGLLRFFIIFLYKISMKNAKAIIFQNDHNRKYFESIGINNSLHLLVPGSGVNLVEFNYLPYPIEKEFNFLFIGRVMKDKGIDNFLETAKYIKEKHANANFYVLGSYEYKYKQILMRYKKNNFIKFFGIADNIKDYLSFCSAVIHPSLHEGMSNVLLEASSSGRPIIASNIPGCKEIINEGVNGFTFEVGNQLSLNSTVEKFIKLSHSERESMGINGRIHVKERFDRTIVVSEYMKVIL